MEWGLLYGSQLTDMLELAIWGGNTDLCGGNIPWSPPSDKTLVVFTVNLQVTGLVYRTVNLQPSDR